MNAALSQLAPVPVSDHEIQRLRRGQPIAGPAANLTREGYALSSLGEVVAILRPDVDRGEWWPHKVFARE
jgi:hypothetical protein